MRYGFLRHAILTLALCIASGAAWAYDTKATAAFVYDVNTDTVLLAKNADAPMPPASMSKLMTVYMAFEAVKSGRLTLETKLPVSQHAMNYKGSTMFLDTTDRVTVADLLRGIIVLSGNDASAVIAEALSPTGTEQGFADLMTKRARELGMTQSTFANSNGWPAPNHRMSMRDLVTLSQALIRDFPELYKIFGETSFAFDNRAPKNVRNRNPLLYLNIGADGLKTGHTSEAGYGLAGSVVQGDRRVIFAFTGLNSEQERAAEAEAIVNWAFRTFSEAQLATPGQILAQAPVWMGDTKTIGLTVKEPLTMLIAAYASTAPEAKVTFQSPLLAPLSVDTPVATMTIHTDGIAEGRSVDLYPAQSVDTGGFGARIGASARYLMDRFMTKLPEAS